MRIRLARHPDRLDAANPLIVEEMLVLAGSGKQVAVKTIVEMVADLREHGRASRYLKQMKGVPIYELKPRSRGGEKGGTRVYLFIAEHDEAGLVTCEVKDGDSPNPLKLKIALTVARAYKRGIPVLQTRRGHS